VSLKAELEKQVEELKKQMPDATQSVDKTILVELEKQQAKLKEIEEQIATRSRRRRSIEGAIESYSALEKSTRQEVGKIQRQLIESQVADAIVQKLMPIWSNDVVELLRKEVEKLDVDIGALKGVDTTLQSPSSVTAIQAEISRLKELVAKDEVSRKRLLDLQKQIAERTANAERLAKEIENLDQRVVKTLEKQEAKQVLLYLKVFEALSTDKAGLKELYSPMQDAINQLGEEMQFSVSVGYQIDSKSWLDKAARFFDGRRIGAEAKRLDIERIVESKLMPAWKSGDLVTIESAFKDLLYTMDIPTFPEKFGTSKLSRVELYDWIFSVEHIDLSYKIHYSGTELEYLSPGTRGIALLVLYLLMDEDDTRPLLIDQPEGNLDNSSVYKQLVPYIRKAKKRRQIILITHNPNLVVATDAEQIIIATAERPITQPYPCIRYDSGGLEHSVTGINLGIREAVCLLLEGGEDAFRARENRYSLVQI
jgi:hypothetical protein